MTDAVARAVATEHRSGPAPAPGPLRTRVVSALGDLDALAPAWDALAVEAVRPRSAPAWVLAWYRHALPSGAEVRAVVVTEGDALVGMCPLFVARTGFGLYRYALAAPMLHGVEPLCAPGREEEVGRALGAALASAAPVPDVVVLDWGRADSPVPGALQRGWPRPHPSLAQGAEFPGLRVVLEGRDFESWLATRSHKFRKGFRYDLRRLQAVGFEHRMSTEAPDVLRRLPAVQRLYEVRRQARGGAGEPFDETFTAVVSDAVSASSPGRVALSTLERGDEVIACGLILSAGNESTIWLAGFDEAWSQQGPSRVNLALCVEASAERGDAVFDLGSGGHAYKYRFTEDAVALHHLVVARRGLRPFHGPVQLLPYGARQALVRVAGNAKRSARGVLGGSGGGPPQAAAKTPPAETA